MVLWREHRGIACRFGQAITLAEPVTEYFHGSAVTDQKGRDTWVGDGSPDARKRACEIARKILAAEEKPYLDVKADQAIRKKYEILL